MVIVALMLVTPVVDAGQASAADVEATLAIHRRVCPPGVFTDLYNVCHHLSQRAGVTIYLSGAEKRRALTDTAGNVMFERLTPGLYFTGPSSPGGDFTHQRIFCSAADTSGVYRPVGAAAIILAAGDSVVCDWYVTSPDMSPDAHHEHPPTPVLPTPQTDGTSVTISSWLCPTDYVNDDYAAACRDQVAPDFQYWTHQIGAINAPVAGQDGVVRFDLSSQPIRGVVVLGSSPLEGRHGKFHTAIVDCIGNAGRLETPTLDNLSNYQMVGIPVTPGDQIHCDWYNVPYGRS
jgi:hypothetical protein